MRGYIDQINRETISGWIFGRISLLEVEIDGYRQLDIEIRYIERQDVMHAYPDRVCTGFEISTPLTILDGRLHEVILSVAGVGLENSPAKFRYVDKRILFIHTPKTGGSSINDALRFYKSNQGKSHIETLEFSPLIELLGVGKVRDIPRPISRKINHKFVRNNLLHTNTQWLSGHVSPQIAHILINKFSGTTMGLAKSYAIKKFTSIYSHSFNKTIEGFDVIGCVRNPITCLISHLNWHAEIYEGRSPDFFYDHNVVDMGKIAFYVAKFEKNSLNYLSQILNLNLLNTQCRFIAPNLIIEPTPQVARKEIQKFSFVGRLENAAELVRKVTYQENTFGVFHSNKTNIKKILWEDFDPSLKNFLYRRMKPDLLLYDTVCEYFG
jgi:hypothetical protein